MNREVVVSCCCQVCGNCTKAPTHDNRQQCCCSACGHCFRVPVTTYYPYYPWYPANPQAIRWLTNTAGTVAANSANHALLSGGN